MVDESLEEVYPQYLNGACEVFAIALHRLTGYPIQCAVTFDDDVGMNALVHAWVTHPDGAALDVKGLRSVDEILSEDFPDAFEPGVLDITEVELIRFVHKRSTPKVEAAIVEAMSVAKQVVEALDGRASVLGA